MPTNVELLKTRLSAIYVELACLDGKAASPDPRSLPNTSGPGTNIDAQGHRKSLLDEAKMINELITVADGGGFDITSEGFV